MANRFAEIIRAAQENFAARGGLEGGPKRPRLKRQHTRQIVRVGRLDKIEWEGNLKEENGLFSMTPVVGVRNDAEVNTAIEDLFYGDRKNPDERPPYLNGPELLQDIFMTFLHPNPQLYKKAEVVKDARLNGKFIEQMMNLPVYEEIHDYTMNDPETSKDAMLALVDVVKDLIKQHREAVEESNKQREESGTDPNGPPGNGSNPDSWDEESGKSKSSKSGGKNKDNGGKSKYEKDDDADDENEENWDHREEEEEDSSDDDGESDDDTGEGEEGDGDDGEGLLDQQERDENFDDEQDQAESDWEKMVEDLDLGRLANAALEKAAEEMGDLKEARAGIGLDEADWKMMDPKERMRLAKQLNTPRMKAIANMVGRMKRFAMSKQAQKIIDAPHEIYTIKQGSDLTRTVRSEFGLLGLPETKIWFYYKFINGELLQYEKRGHEDVGKGPIIVCIDNSGSMGGVPENWAKGVAEALRRIAAEQGRDYYAIYFETNSHRERFDFPEGKGPFDKVMAFLSVSAGGGTEFDGVLTEALSKAQSFAELKGDSHGKSDIVFITDGMANLNQGWIDKFNDERKAAGVRVFSIHISAYDYDRGPCMGLLKRFSDVAVPVKALEVGDDTTDELFATI